MKKIALVILYIGPFNNYFELFLKSCEYNPTIDWIIFTDNKIENMNIPANVKIVNMTFKEIKNRIQSIYNFKITLETPYEFCDFKVAYGEVFQDYLTKYDFWGYCDNDLIFGDIRNFITNEILENYEKILIRGHFTLFKNTDEINKLYRNLIDGKERYKEVFTTRGNYHFDEGLADLTLGINRIFKDANVRVYDEYNFMDLEVSRFDFINADFINDENEINISKKSLFTWEKGKLYRYYIKNEKIYKQEFMYIHFQKRKMKNKLNNIKNIDKYTIIPNKFIPYDISFKTISKSNIRKIYFVKIIEKWKRRSKKLFKLVLGYNC